MKWRSKAACLDEDPEMFYPVGTTGPALDQIAKAKAVCRRCEVAAHCLAFALESNEPDGVWGGMTTDERRALRRRRRNQDGA
jgi:WhiB family transcriptional regulator, redox-sensing transcriptional regulator